MHARLIGSYLPNKNLKMVGLSVLVCCWLSGCGEGAVVEAQDNPDPVVVDIPLAFIKRSLPVDEDGLAILTDLREPAQFIPGAALYIKARASVSAPEINLTDRLFVDEGVDVDSLLPEDRPQYDIKDLSVSYDGTLLLFAMRAPELEGVDDEDQPSWNIWQYDRRDDSLTRIIQSDIVAEAGDDSGPEYLPDGRIVFSSTRQRTNQAILLDEGKPQYAGLDERMREPASVLHVMDANGENIEQISFNQSHDLDPVVQSDGRILFTRWDHAGGDKGMHLYSLNPDGSDVQIVYGRHSHALNDQQQQFTRARLTPDGGVLVSVRPYQATRLGDNFVTLDIDQYIDNNRPIASADSLSGPAQQAALFDNVDTQANLSPGGYFADVYPLWDGSGRQLISWSQCRVLDVADVSGDTTLPCTEELLADEQSQPASELYGLWLYDPTAGTQQVIGVPQEGIAYTEVVSMESRDYPADFVGAETFDTALAGEGKGLLHILSVYDFAGEDTSPNGLTVTANPELTRANERPYRFIRVVKAVSMPDDDVQEVPNFAFGPNRNQRMREIVGYAEIEPDGSVMMEVPANVPLAISLLDADGKRVSERHNNWLQVAAGEVKTCYGCHSRNSTAPHGRTDAEYPSINSGAANNGQAFAGANPALFADIGDTMAQTRRRVLGPQYLQADIVYQDVWSDPATTALADTLSLSYADLQTRLPVNQSCAQNWTPLCRIVINYDNHIQPMFELPRQVLDELGEVVSDHTCISCHSPANADGETQIPAAQLDLTGSPSTDNPDVLTSYRELFFTDNQQHIVEGILLDELQPLLDANGDVVYATDEQGELLLDEQGNPIPMMTTLSLSPPASSGGAIASRRLFSVLETGTHAGWLSPAERKLLAEWLDIGGQYYNNPFDVPQD